jgi:hypothetical protein
LSRIADQLTDFQSLQASSRAGHEEALDQVRVSVDKTITRVRKIIQDGNRVVYAEVADVFQPGITFAEIIEIGAARGVIASAKGGQLMAYQQFPFDEDAETAGPLTLQLKPSIPLKIEVIDRDGQPVEGARTGVQIEFLLPLLRPQQTDASGSTTHLIPADATIHTVYAWKPQVGLDYRSFVASPRYRTDQPLEELDPSEPITLALTGTRTVHVKVLDGQTEQPIEGMRLYPSRVKKPGEPDDFHTVLLGEARGAITDADGLATFNWLPTWDKNQSLVFWYTSEDYERVRGTYDYAAGDGTLTMKRFRLVPIRGQVRLPDGQPAKGITLPPRRVRAAAKRGCSVQSVPCCPADRIGSKAGRVNDPGRPRQGRVSSSGSSWRRYGLCQREYRWRREPVQTARYRRAVRR